MSPSYRNQTVARYRNLTMMAAASSADLESLTPAQDYGTLPPLDHLTELVLYAEADIDIAAAQHPHLRVIRINEPYFPPFRPDDV